VVVKNQRLTIIKISQFSVPSSFEPGGREFESLRARNKFFTGPQSESGKCICEIVGAADGTALVVRNGFSLEVTL
jgi:hypothetical protein